MYQPIPPDKAKKIKFFKSGDSNFAGLQLAVSKRKYRSFDGLLSDLTTKVSLPYGVRTIHTPGGIHGVHSLEDFEDGQSYVVSSSRKKKPMDLGRVRKPRAWHNARLMSPQESSIKGSPTGSLSPRSSPDRADGKNDHSPTRLPRTPKKIMVMRNGDVHTKHMMLMNRRTAQSFEDVLADISEIFRTPVKKLYSAEGMKIESLSGMFNGPELFVAAKANEKFKSHNYIDNSPFKYGRPRNRLRRKSEDFTDQPPAKVFKKSRGGKWKVVVCTNDNPAASTDAVVSLTVYGDKGKTDDLELGFGEGRFQSGSIDEFNVHVGNVGEIYKVRISQDDSTECAGWLCDELRMEDAQTGELMVFPCQRWMAREEEDSEICRELPVMRDGQPLFPVVVYEVAVVTGNYWNAGTEASVYLTIIGDRGDTGHRQLYKSKNKKKFEKGKTDIFNVEAVSLGNLRKIIIGHDTTDSGCGWFLNKVVIHDSLHSSQETIFSCYSWLDVGIGDGKVVRELVADSKPPNLEKEMWEMDKWKFKRGSQLLFFSKVTGKAVRLKPDGSVEATGDIDGKDKTAYFEADKVRNNIYVFRSVTFPDCHLCIETNRITGQGKGGTNCEFKVRIQPDRTVVLEAAKGTTQIATFLQSGKPGDSRGPSIGPSRQLHCYVKGAFCDDGVVLFYTSRTQVFTNDHNGVCVATGEKTEDAYWRVHKVNEGNVCMFESVQWPKTFLQIKNGYCNVQGTGNECCHFVVTKYKEKGFVTLTSVQAKGQCVGFLPDGVTKPTVDTGENNVRLYPEVIHFGKPKVVPEEAPKKKRGKKKSKPEPVATPPPTSPEAEQFEDGDWKVYVKTGKVATKETVVLVVYGDKKVSEPFQLGKGGGELFQPNQEDEFKVNLLGIGEIYKIRIGLESENHKGSWQLSQVKMKDMATTEHLFFKFKNRMFSRKEDDGDVWRELPAVRPGKKPLPVHKYHVEVHTGTEPASDTDANVYLNIFGQKGDTGKRLLHRSNKEEKFQGGQIDVFELQAVTVLRPSTVIVGHDGNGAGAGWYLKQVIIKESSDAKTEYIFTCNRWLDEGQDDNAIERELELTEIKTIQANDWQIYVTTGSNSDTGTSSKVTLYAYGDKTVEDVVLLPDHGNGFQPGTTEDFRVNLGDIGTLYKIRIGHDNSQSEGSWYLKTVKIVDLFEGNELNFEFDRWLSREHDDLDTWRELPAVSPLKKPLPVTKYYVMLWTGSIEEAETNANVFMNIHGKYGDTGKRQLVKSKNNEQKFRSGQMDVFEIEAVWLGKISKAVLGHDGKSAGDGWFVEKVTIKESKAAKNEVYFACRKWFDVGKADKKIRRELLPGKPPTIPKPITQEEVEVGTTNVTVKWKKPAGELTGYCVKCMPAKIENPVINIKNPSVTQADFTGLTPGNEYTFDIISVNQDLEGDPVTISATAKPNPPTDGEIKPSFRSISVNWEAPDEGNCTGYKVKLTPADSKQSSLKMDVTKRSAEFQGLTPGKKYRVEIMVLSGEAESEKLVLRETTKIPEVVLLPVLDAVTVPASHSIEVSWKQPEGNMNGYQLKLDPPDGDEPEQAINTPTCTEAKFTGLSPGREYEIEIVTVFDFKKSDVVKLTARTSKDNVVPVVIKASSLVNGTSAKISWIKPEEGSITGYKVSCKQDVDTGELTKEVVLEDPEVLKTTFSDLTQGQIYIVEIITVSGAMESDGVKLEISTKSMSDQVRDPKTDSTRRTIVAGWKKPEKDCAGYRVTISPPDSDQNEVVINDPQEAKATFNGLSPGREYTLSIFSTNGEVESEPVEVIKHTKPHEVLNAASEATSKSITVHWNRPSGELTGYKVVCLPLVSGPEPSTRSKSDLSSIKQSPAGKYERSNTEMTPSDKKKSSKTDERSKSRSRSRAGDREKSKTGERSKDDRKKSGAGERSKSRTGERSKSRTGERSKSRTGERSKSRTGERPKSRAGDKSKGDGKSKTKADNKVGERSKSRLDVKGGNRRGSVTLKENQHDFRKAITINLDEKTTRTKINDLEGGCQYIIDIFTVAGEQESKSINLKQRTKPEVVQDAKVEPLINSMSLTWQPPDGKFTHYQVNFGLSGSDNTEIRILDPERTKIMFSELQPEQEYAANIFTLVGDVQSEPITLIDKTLSAEKPIPVIEAKTESTLNSIIVTWKKPAGNFTEFKVLCVMADCKEAKPVEKMVAANTFKAEFTELEPGEEYNIQIWTLHKELLSEHVQLKEKTKSDKPETHGEWNIFLNTCEDSKPVNNGLVHLVAYGKDGKSEKILLTQEKEHTFFQAGATDEFEINVGEIGEIYKVRVGMEDDHSWEGWHVDELCMIDKHTEEKLFFTFDRWMSRTKDDFDIVREMPAVRENQDVLPVNVYHVTLDVGDHLACYTDANVWIVLHGERGDSGKRLLYHALEEPRSKFMKSQKDTFKVEAVALGEIKIVEVSHDGVGYGAGMFVEHFVIKENVDAKDEFYFQCNQWLDDHVAERKTEMQFKLFGARPINKEEKEDRPNSKGTWKVTVKTSDLPDAGTKAKVYLTICGANGDSDPQHLDLDEFIPNGEGSISVDAGDVGEVKKVRLTHDNSGENPKWHVDEIKIEDEVTEEVYTFRFDSWLSHDLQGHDILEMPVLVPDVEPPQVCMYQIRTLTNKEEDADTDGNVSVTIYGDNGNTGKRMLVKSNKEKTFLYGQEDAFLINAVSLGKLEKVVFHFQTDVDQEAWLLDYATIREDVFSLTETMFPCYDWLGLNPNTGNALFEKELIAGDEQPVETVIDDDEEEPLDDGESKSKGKWLVWVTTGRDDDMGTDANVTLQVYGKKGSSEVLPLKKEDDNTKKDDDDDKEENQENEDGVEKATWFPPGSVEEFEIDIGEIGALYKIRIAHDNSNKNPDWFIEKVKMKDKDTHQEFHYFVNRWLKEVVDINLENEVEKGKIDEKKKEIEDKDQAKEDKVKNNEEEEKKAKEEEEDMIDDTCLELAAIRPDAPVPLVHKYEVAIHTGNRGSSWTDTQPFIVVCGEKGDTGKRQLKRLHMPKSDKKHKFGRNQVDTFLIEAVDLIRPNKLILGHNEKGYGAGWFVEKVIIKEASDSATQFVFPCQRWLDEGVEDGKLEREIKLLGEVECTEKSTTKGNWKVSVRTNMKSSDDMNSEVTLFVYDNRGQYSHHPLLKGEEKDKKLFDPGTEDNFKINVGNLGVINKVRIEVNQSEDDPKLYVEWIKMVDEDTKENLMFEFPSRIKLCKEVAPIRDGNTPEPVVTYKVQCHTGDKEDSGTEANQIFMTIFGSKGDTGRRLLSKSNNFEMFKKEQVDNFEIEAVSVGKIHTVEVVNRSKDPWFLQQVLVTQECNGNNKTEAKKVKFDCSSWVGAEGEEDDEKEEDDEDRDLEPIKSFFVEENWTCFVRTSDLPECGMDKKLQLVAYGDKGKSSVMVLDNSNNDNYEPGKQAEFKVNPGNWFGDLTKLRVEVFDESEENNNENDTKKVSWHLKEIEIVDDASDTKHKFEFNKWFSNVEEGSDVINEFPALIKGHEPLPLVNYKLDFHTGSDEHAATDSDVVVTIFGSAGDTGSRKLLKTTDGGEKFDKPDKIDSFLLEAVTVGQIKHILIEKSSGKPWQLEKVIVKEGQYTNEEMVFKCNKWIGSTESPDEDATLKLQTYLVQPSLFVDPEITEAKPKSNGNWKLTITTGENADSKEAGTTAKVMLTVIGTDSSSDPEELGQDKPTKFQAGTTDEFKISLKEIGRIWKLRFQLESEEDCKSWFVEKIKMKDEDTNEEFSMRLDKWVGGFDGKSDAILEVPAVWPELEEPQVIQYVTTITTSETDHSDTTANAYIIIAGENSDSSKRWLTKSNQDNKFQVGQEDVFEIEAVGLGQVKKVTLGHDGKDKESAWLVDRVTIKCVNPEDLMKKTQKQKEKEDDDDEEEEDDDNTLSFQCPDWLSLESTDQLTERVLQPLDEEDWKIFITTGEEEDASTHAKVSMTIIGSKDSSDDLVLSDDPNGTFFNIGNTAEFEIGLTDIGKPYKIRVFHDNSGDDPSWLLGQVVMQKVSSTESITFDCNKWLSRDHGNGEIVGEFPAVHPNEEAPSVIEYRVQVDTGNEEGSDTIANAYIIVYGENGDTGKRDLFKNVEDKIKFQKGATDTFIIEAVSLGDLKKCVIGHDGKGQDSGWFLERVRIKEAEDTKQEYVFECNKWLSDDQDDKKTERELEVTPQTEGNSGTDDKKDENDQDDKTDEEGKDGDSDDKKDEKEDNDEDKKEDESDDKKDEKEDKGDEDKKEDDKKEE